MEKQTEDHKKSSQANSKTETPFPVKLIAWVTLIYGVLGLIVSLFLTALLALLFNPTYGILLTFLYIGMIILSFGIRYLKKWALYAYTAITVIGVGSFSFELAQLNTVLLLSTSWVLIPILLQVLAIFYLWNIAEKFGVEEKRKLKRRVKNIFLLVLIAAWGWGYLQSIPRTIQPATDEESLVVVLSSSSYVNNKDILVFTAEIQNESNQTVEIKEIKVIFFDEDGNELYSSSLAGDEYFNLLGPQEKTPLRLYGAPSFLEDRNYKIEFSSQKSVSGPPYTDFEITDVSFSEEQTIFGHNVLRGTITNTGDKTVDSIFALPTFYDKSEVIVGTGFDVRSFLGKDNNIKKGPPLRPGQSEEFALSVDPEILQRIDSYIVQAQGVIVE